MIRSLSTLVFLGVVSATQPLEPQLEGNFEISQIDTPAGGSWFHPELAYSKDLCGIKTIHPPNGVSDYLVFSNLHLRDEGPKRIRLVMCARTLFAESSSIQQMGWHNEQGFLVGWRDLRIDVVGSEYQVVLFETPRVFAPSTYCDPQFGLRIKSASMTTDGSLSGCEIDLITVELVD